MGLTKQEFRLLKNKAAAIEDAAEVLRNLLTKVEHTYITDEDYDDGADSVYLYDESTIIRWSDKHGMPFELVVMKIKKGGTLICNGIYDTYGENIDMEISVHGVLYGDLVSLANLLPDTICPPAKRKYTRKVDYTNYDNHLYR